MILSAHIVRLLILSSIGFDRDEMLILPSCTRELFQKP